jgi:hypothetical protein
MEHGYYCNSKISLFLFIIIVEAKRDLTRARSESHENHRGWRGHLFVDPENMKSLLFHFVY